MGKYLLNVAIAVDQLLNTICGGDPDETISSRIGKRRDQAERISAWVVDRLFFWQRDHTRSSIEPDGGDDASLK